jgi:DNA-binding NarL/FixJ family response regulator
MKLKILIVDDMDSMRLLVTQYLRRIDEVTVVGQAVDGEEAIRKAKESNPDIILMDISLPGGSGVEVTRKIKALLPKVRVYLFSAYEVDEFREIIDNSPADGFIQKSCLKPELIEMIQKELERRKDSES